MRTLFRWSLPLAAVVALSCDPITDEDLWARFDADGDGYPVYQATTSELEYDGELDCDDTSADVHPGAPELCDGVDNDCDGEIDEDDAQDAKTWYADADADGFGDADAGLESCAHPPGYVEDATDCDDADPDVNPDSAWYADVDGDGFGDPDSEDGATGCENPDPDTLVPNGDDCDDDAPDVFPGADEVVNNGGDEDCDGFDSCYRDGDGDAYGSTVLLDSADLDCSDEGESGNGSDCDDGNGLVSPSAIEACNGFDDDCDGDVDEGVLVTSYEDADDDGFGDASTASSACDVPSGRVTNDDDCDDAEPDVSPDGEETVDDAIDQDCDGGDACWQDKDDDDHGTATVVDSADLDCDDAYEATVSTDCDDANALVSPVATETCNSVDDDCDGLIDEGVTATAYRDADGDGYGSSTGTASTGCSIPSGYSAISGDCDDGSALVSPVGTETCNGADDDCDGTVDDGVKLTFYADSDGDSYGGTTTTSACSAPSGYVADATDCDDTDSGDFPGASEVINNGDDEDCDGGDSCYTDADDDDYGIATAVKSSDLACDSTNEATVSTDCDDTSASDYPGATEVVNNGDDEDCDGGDACYQDSDGDYYGSTTVIASADLSCDDAGEATLATDCDDTDSGDYPGAGEIINNGDDEDCDGGDTCYVDYDNDNYGSIADFASADLDCKDANEAENNDDCDDSDAGDYPGATEIVNNLDDEDCDGVESCYQDGDDDDYGTVVVIDSLDVDCADSSEATVSTDCDDKDKADNPGAAETVGDDDDDDCDGTVVCWVDADDDSYRPKTGTATVISGDLDCGDASEAMDTDPKTDCDDAVATVHPYASETCNSVDDNCDGNIDEGLPFITYYKDADGDGYGLTSTTTSACAPLLGYATAKDDCDDTKAAVSPAATEYCDGIDNDCDGTIDTDAVDITTWYYDGDGDGYGIETSAKPSKVQCTKPTGYASISGDCDDADAAESPGKVESARTGSTCSDGKDNDCDTKIDSFDSGC